MRKKPLVTLAVLLSLTLILSACGGSNPSSATGTQPPAANSESEPEEGVTESDSVPTDAEPSAPDDTSDSEPINLTLESMRPKPESPLLWGSITRLDYTQMAQLRQRNAQATIR